MNTLNPCMPKQMKEKKTGTLQELTCFSCSHQDINGEVQDLSQLAGKFEYVASGCGKACENNACENNGKCLDNYNVYLCDCSKTPFYGYFCHKGKLCCVRVLADYQLLQKTVWEARWPRGYCARLRIEWSGFGAWPGTLCCVLGQDTLLSRCLSPPRFINGYRRNAGGNPAMD